MYTITFQLFPSYLEIDIPTHEIPNKEAPVIIVYSQLGNISDHEILKRFCNVLSSSDITYIRPNRILTSEWIIDLKELKSNFSTLSEFNYLRGKFTIEPEIIKDRTFCNEEGRLVVRKTILKFIINKDDVENQFIPSTFDSIIPDDILTSSKKFFKDYGKNEFTAFLMMKFEDTPLQMRIVNIIKDVFLQHKIKVLRADDKQYSDDLFSNIKTYMHCCDFGIGLFDRVNTEYFNPNVSLEIGYMMALNKPVLLLKDKTLSSLHSDLVSKLYSTFDFQSPEEDFKRSISKWLEDKEII